MSAIFGVLRFDGGAVSRGNLERMRNSLAHRGPDGSKFVLDAPVGFGHCLMRVNREDAFEAQPLVDRETGLTLVADCRIDNREELAEAFALAAADIRETPDSAFILRAYKKWGEDCAEHLLGDFAFAVWDARTRKLFLARDHMGQRYVHYHHGKEFFAFATEIKALWAVPGVPRVLGDRQIGRILLGDRSPHHGQTPFDGIAGLTGATTMSVDVGGAVLGRRYWEPRADPQHNNRDEAYYIAAYRQILGEAVACRIRRTIRPPGIMFSGGYDSAAIAGLAQRVLAEQGRKLVAAASVMPADYHGDIRHARRWVEMCARDMPHLDVRFVTREGKSVLSGLERAFAATGLPGNAYHFVNSELHATLASAGVKVVMDGQGGDFTLNPRGQAFLAYLLTTRQFLRFWSELRGHLRSASKSLWRTLRSDIVAPLMPVPIAARWRCARQWGKPIWHARPVSRAFAHRLFAEGKIRSSDLGQFPRRQYAMRERMAAAQWRATAAPAPHHAVLAAQHGLQLTRPFYDKWVVELALAIPEDLYVKDGRNRYLACAALKDIYPREFQARWRRNDDPVPDFQRMAKVVEPQVLDEIARMEKSELVRRYFDFTKIRQLLAARDVENHNSGWEQETQLALNAFVLARYVEWFRGENEIKDAPGCTTTHE